MSENSLLQRLDGIEGRFEEVSTLITDPDVIADMRRYVKLTKEYKELEKLVEATRRYRNLLANIDEARQVLDTERDDELRAMAREEIDSATGALPELEEQIKLLL
ncbi:MAG: PCRF domain-containing protein, partial [Muribaculaceae bacterium]|nr:PCRF domain-containing protein [Muribaculaceae bacterium]